MEELKQEILKNIDTIVKELKKGNDINIKTSKSGLRISRVETIIK